VLREFFLRVMTNSWPDKVKDVDKVLKPYYYRKNEITIEQGCVLWGYRLVIPSKFCSILLDELHQIHMGTVSGAHLILL
jgi:hypothetical protein